MAKSNRKRRASGVTAEERNKRMSEEAMRHGNWLPELNRMWAASSTDQLQYWIAKWEEFCAIVEEWDPLKVYYIIEPLRSATQLARCGLLSSGESQGADLAELTAHIDRLFASPAGPMSILNGAGLLDDQDVDFRQRVGVCTAMPPTLMAAGRRAEADVRRVLDQAHVEPRLRARIDSLVARLAVTVLRNDGVLMKQRAHLLHTGRDRKPSDSLEKLMTPKGQWVKARFGTVDGDYLRASAAGRRQAERLAELGVKPLGD